MKRFKYNPPYMGGKGGIANNLIQKMIELKLQADTFVDLFGGGILFFLIYFINIYHNFYKYISQQKFLLLEMG